MNRLQRLLCLICAAPTVGQPNGQRYCPHCQRCWSFRWRQVEWSLLQAFALNATASDAAAVCHVTVGTAAAHFRRFRDALIEDTATRRAEVYTRLQIDPPGPIRQTGLSRKPMILGLVEVSNRVLFVRSNVKSVELREKFRAARLTGLVLAAPPGEGFAGLRVVEGESPPSPAEVATVTRLRAFWATARNNVLRYRSVRVAYLGGLLAEQEVRYWGGVKGVIQAVFRRTIDAGFR